jgi:membrane protein DedA with SNARE-associated domain
MSWFDIGEWLDSIGRLDPTLIYLIIGGLALLESAAFLGLIVPGEAAVLVGGAIAGQGDANLVVMIAVVAVGATVGDSLSYELGRHTGPWLTSSRLGRAIGDQRLEAGARHLQRRGAKAVFFGRFIAIVRTGVPVLAGAARMRYRSFLAWNIAGAVLWSVLHVSVGYAAGNQRNRLESIIRGGGLGVAAVIGLALVAYKLHQRRQDAHAQIDVQPPVVANDGVEVDEAQQPIDRLDLAA